MNGLRWAKTIAGIALLALANFTSSAVAKTPDGQTPAQETACDGLTGSAFGLCTAYCEAQDCDAHERPSCAPLRLKFERITGSSTLPCDAPICGDGVIGQGEECDPPDSSCGDGTICRRNCTCPLAACLEAVRAAAAQCTAPCGDVPGRCVGDCDGDAHVLFEELALACEISDGTQRIEACAAIDANSDAEVDTTELFCAACNFAVSCP